MKHELSSMKAFVILAESSSFNNAAKLLNITQPALTRRIKKMEEDLHIQLFERTTRKVTLTKAGKRLLPEARELIKKFDETLFNIRDMNAYHRGMVTLACIPTAVFYFLPLAIGKFNELYPNIKVRILEQGTNNCMESVLCNESDFGINMNNVTNSSIDFTPLVNEPFVLACRRDHPLAKKHRKGPAGSGHPRCKRRADQGREARLPRDLHLQGRRRSVIVSRLLYGTLAVRQPLCA